MLSLMPLLFRHRCRRHRLLPLFPLFFLSRQRHFLFAAFATAAVSLMTLRRLPRYYAMLFH